MLAALVTGLGESVRGAVVSAPNLTIDAGSTATNNWSVNGYAYPYDEKFGSGSMTYSQGGTTNFNLSYNSDYISGRFTEYFANPGVFSRSISGGANYKRYYIPNGLLDSSGYMTFSKSFTITVRPRLVVNVPASATEGDGVLSGQGSVSMATTFTNDLAVALTSSKPSEVLVTNAVTIVAGQTNATFDLQILDDSILDGSQTVLITASASGCASGSSTMSATAIFMYWVPSTRAPSP